MRKRTLAREFALQILYQWEITKDDIEFCLENFWQERAEKELDAELKNFTAKLVKGTVSCLKEIDQKISSYAQNWQLERMALVDRNVMRLGCFELLYCDDIPSKVSINEAVEIAKRFSSPEAGKFVNAILDKIKAEIGK